MQVVNKCACGEVGVYGTLLSAQFFCIPKITLKINSISTKQTNKQKP